MLGKPAPTPLRDAKDWNKDPLMPTIRSICASGREPTDALGHVFYEETISPL